MFDILAVLITLIWILCSMKDKIKWVAWVNVPYLLWVAFATVLQINVTILNL
jgi:tryptophan-rich sensory protein